MSMIAWNCRGLGAAATIRKLGDIVRDERPLLVFLSKTKCGKFRIDCIKERLGMFGVGIPAKGKSGGLALLWDKSVCVQLRSFSSNHIDADVITDCESVNWRFTGFYGEPDVTRRKTTWELLKRLSMQSDAPWLCVGDYNEVLFQYKKTGALRQQWQMNDFRLALEQSGLSDLGFRGPLFTWCNRREHPHTILARLDRACGNASWLARFPTTTVTHHLSPYFDHAILVIYRDRLDTTVRTKKKSRFRFEAKWLQSEECGVVVEEACDGVTEVDPNYRLWLKVQACRVRLLQ
ncbi:UNVERIFIED_CONTAM: hypothetical protein Slati_0691900 [Sesamum latifolium]|uniref:Endonuclease/exonuclease/phosphatase domain-containing protein n=1 Tax=Sesamum latifolium TaxID=2727402 RepID=A0AAW2Y4F1_9LAMI